MEEGLMLKDCIIFEHDDFVIVNKPPHISVQDEDGKLGFLNELRKELPTISLVHRLDKETSGLMIFPKNKEATTTFGKLFQNHEISKIYIALAEGKPSKKQGSIVGDMDSSRRKQYKLLRTKNNPAKTHFYSHFFEEGVRIYILKPYSGKTHQLRVAMKSLGCPILGDSIYGGNKAERMYLHSFSLKFSYNSEEYNFEVLPILEEADPYQDKLKSSLESIENVQKLRWPSL